MILIAFSGRMGSGKTTAATHLANKLLDAGKTVAIINIADRIKEIFLELFIPAEWAWKMKDLNENKNKMLPTIHCTVRFGLQWFGSDVCRKAWPGAWVNAYLQKLMFSRDFDFIVCSDVRFKNELKFIQDGGGFCFRLLLNRHPEIQHESEIDLDMIEKISMWNRPENSQNYILFDAIIDNRKTTEKQKNTAIVNVAKQKGWL